MDADFSEKDKTRAWHSRHLLPWPGRSSRCPAWGFCCRSPCSCHQASGPHHALCGPRLPGQVSSAAAQVDRAPSSRKHRRPNLHHQGPLPVSQLNPSKLCKCLWVISFEDMVLRYSKTTVPSKANVYAVTVENRCICTQANIKLACSGFNSSVAIDPAGVLNVDGDGKLCTLNGGHPIGMGPEYTVKFSYASPSGQFGLKPVSSSIACS